MEKKQEIVDQIREFNRFYTVLLGFLNRNYLDSGYSVTETRILFELHQRGCGSANQLVELLQLDKSYISRLLRGFEQKGLVTRQPSPQDGRAVLVQLTPQGQAETERLIAITNRKISELIEPLDADACDALCAAMRTILAGFRGRAEQ